MEKYYKDGKVGLQTKAGEVLTEAMFDSIEPLSDNVPILVGYIGRHPYVIRKSDGRVIDFFRIDARTIEAALEKVMNWVLPGLQLFYRDTDTPIDVEKTFHVGDILRAGFFIDMSPYAGKPMHRYRYIIASSHAASLAKSGIRYPLHILHYNSYLKVMDIYEKSGVTQIFLLHVPAKAIFLPGINGRLNFSFNGEETLIDIARKSLDTKLTLPPKELLEETGWLDRTSWHVGIDKDGQPLSLFPNILVANENTLNMGKSIREMAKDTDTINLILENMESNNTLQDRIRGSLIGGAIGDALGYPVEFIQSFERIQAKYGERGITRLDTKPHLLKEADQKSKAVVSDDTQMTLFTANGLLNAIEKGVLPKYGICKAYIEWYQTQTGKKSSKYKDCWISSVPELNARRAPGLTCLSALENIYRGKEPNNNSKGCGGVMRVAPIPLYAAVDGRMSIEDADLLAGEAAEITHQHPLGYIPAALMSHVIYRLALDPEPTQDSLKRYIREGVVEIRKLYQAHPADVDYMAELAERAIHLLDNGKTDVENIGLLGEGWTGEEALAIALYCALKHFDSFEDAMIASVNHGGDSDSTGAVTGNILGAAVGYDAIPQFFKDDLEMHDLILHMADDIYRGEITKM